MVRCASGSDGRVRAWRQPEVPSVSRGGCVASCLENVSPISLLTIVNPSSKLYLMVLRGVNSCSASPDAALPFALSPATWCRANSSGDPSARTGPGVPHKLGDSHRFSMICGPEPCGDECRKAITRGACAILDMVILGDQHGRETGSATGTSSNQGGRKRVARNVQQSCDGASPRGRVHAEFCLCFPQRCSGKAVGQHDRQPGTCEAHLARAGRKHFAL